MSILILIQALKISISVRKERSGHAVSTWSVWLKLISDSQRRDLHDFTHEILQLLFESLSCDVILKKKKKTTNIAQMSELNHLNDGETSGLHCTVALLLDNTSSRIKGVGCFAQFTNSSVFLWFLFPREKKPIKTSLHSNPVYQSRSSSRKRKHLYLWSSKHCGEHLRPFTNSNHCGRDTLCFDCVYFLMWKICKAISIVKDLIFPS